MIDLFRGRVLYFDKSGGGLLRTNKKEAPDFVLLEENYTFPREVNGSLILPEEHNKTGYHDPIFKDEIVCHKAVLGEKMLAAPWTYADYWDYANLLIVESDIPAISIRIIRKEKGKRKPIILWRGSRDEFREKFRNGLPKEYSDGSVQEYKASWIDVKT